jgi:hypothetical protein
VKVAIVGSRGYAGGARGVDSVAETAAKACGLVVKVYLAQWARHKKLAGFIRNSKIVDASDRVVAFWDGSSHGTADTVEKARIAGKPVEVIR